MNGIKQLTNQVNGWYKIVNEPVNGKKLNIKRITTTINENNFS